MTDNWLMEAFAALTLDEDLRDVELRYERENGNDFMIVIGFNSIEQIVTLAAFAEQRGLDAELSQTEHLVILRKVT